VVRELTGNWKSADGASIILNKDSTCILKNVVDPIKNWETGHDSLVITKINTSGKWKLQQPTKYYRYYCVYIVSEEGRGFLINVEGSGLTGYFKPWKLVVYIGDPDGLNFCEFYKQ
jgi:hypothetical protein